MSKVNVETISSYEVIAKNNYIFFDYKNQQKRRSSPWRTMQI